MRVQHGLFHVDVFIVMASQLHMLSMQTATEPRCMWSIYTADEQVFDEWL